MLPKSRLTAAFLEVPKAFLHSSNESGLANNRKGKGRETAWDTEVDVAAAAADRSQAQGTRF